MEGPDQGRSREVGRIRRIDVGAYAMLVQVVFASFFIGCREMVIYFSRNGGIVFQFSENVIKYSTIGVWTDGN